MSPSIIVDRRRLVLAELGVLGFVALYRDRDVLMLGIIGVAVLVRRRRPWDDPSASACFCYATRRLRRRSGRCRFVEEGVYVARMPFAVTSLTDLTMWMRGNGLEIVLLGVGSILLARIVTWSSAKLTTHIDALDQSDDALVRSEAAKHRHSLTQVITWAALVLIYCVTTVQILRRFNIPVSSLVAPATVAGVALGFGAQRIVQDVLAGFFIITERQYGFGDLIRISNIGAISGVTGTVEDVTLRITRLRTSNGEVVIIPNGQLTQVTNLSRDWARAVVDVPLPASTDIDRINTILRDVGAQIYSSAEFRPLMLDAPTVMGVESIDVATFSIRMVSRTLPGKQFIVGRELRTRISTALRNEGISVPDTELRTSDVRAVS